MEVGDGMSVRHQMVIGGRSSAASSGEWLPVLNPATGERIAEVPAADEHDVGLAVDAARRQFESGTWGNLAPKERALLLNRLADLLESRTEEISRLEAKNNGRPVQETRAQLGIVPDFFRYNAALALTLRAETVPVGGGYLQYLQHVPLGVVGVMTPFNHPMLIAARGVAPALAAGNTVVVKPSELTPLTTLLLVDLAAQAGIPDGALNVVTGLGQPAGAALSEHPDVARVEFTGGTEAGRAVVTAAAQRFGKATAELGGKSPVLVFDDADLEDAAAGVAFAGFVATGQSCIAGARVVVHESVVAEFTDALRKVVDGIKVGDPMDPDTQMGPLISAAARDRTLEYIRGAITEGSTLCAGGRTAEVDARLAEGYFVEPTVLGDVTEKMTIAREEVFGPVVTIETFADENDAVATANATRYGLGAAVWTRDVARAHRVAGQVRAGMVWVNDHHRLSPAMPWGGFKESGTGKQAGSESFENFFEKKSIIVRTEAGAPEWFTKGENQRLN